MNNQEAIERIKHLIELIKSPRTIMPYCREELQALNLAIKALEEQPTGKWIDENCDYTVYTCSNCGDISCCFGNFCPNCGADMRKEKENE